MAGELAGFIALNPESQVVPGQNDQNLIIKNPWADDTFEFHVPIGNLELTEAFNKIHLPRQFTAIRHSDTRDVEFIFGPVRQGSELLNRKFTFRYSGTDYRCEYADASTRLKEIAMTVQQLEPPSSTDYRHLVAIRSFIVRQLSAAQGNADHPITKMRLTSFWIRGVGCDNAALVELSSHINFYMSYFDEGSPIILLHNEVPKLPVDPQLPLHEKPLFPELISGRRLDPYLLSLWASAKAGNDSIRTFLHGYQALEYAAFYHLREETAGSVRRILERPDLHQNSNRYSREILEILAEDKAQDEQKIVDAMGRLVDPDRVWKFVLRHKEFFSMNHEFDGGFCVQPLILKDWDSEDFSASWIPKLPDQLRKIRNALVHAREQRQGKSITPTERNMKLLVPWADLARTIAVETTLHTLTD